MMKQTHSQSDSSSEMFGDGCLMDDNNNKYTTRIFVNGNDVHFTDDINYQTMHDLIKTLKTIEKTAL